MHYSFWVTLCVCVFACCWERDKDSQLVILSTHRGPIPLVFVLMSHVQVYYTNLSGNTMALGLGTLIWLIYCNIDVSSFNTGLSLRATLTRHDIKFSKGHLVCAWVGETWRCFITFQQMESKWTDSSFWKGWFDRNWYKRSYSSHWLKTWHIY